MSFETTFAGLNRSIAGAVAGIETYLRRPGAVPVLIVLLWACATLPNLALRSFLYEEGTNAEIARDILLRGDFLQPFVYGVRLHEKPSLLAWLIAGFATLTGGVSEWSARMPTLLSVVLTALMVQRLTRRYASLHASLFAALCFVFCPLLLQKLTIAEPDALITALSFAALLLWWSGVASERLSIWHWIGCGFLLAVLAMAKGPQPVGFFALGVLGYVVIERRWRDLPGYILCIIMPVAATMGWGAAVYRPGDETTWLSYARLTRWPSFLDYLTRILRTLGTLYLELLPMSLFIPFIPWPWRRGPKPNEVAPPIVAPMILYCGLGTAILFLWPGVNSRYAMPIAPGLAVLAGVAWDRLEKSRYRPLQRVAAVILGLLVLYQCVLTIVAVPLFAEKFGETRIVGKSMALAIREAPAPVYCLALDTNIFFYLDAPPQCRDLNGMAALTPPAWLLMPHSAIADFARLRPDLDIHIARDVLTDQYLAAARIQKK